MNRIVPQWSLALEFRKWRPLFPNCYAQLGQYENIRIIYYRGSRVYPATDNTPLGPKSPAVRKQRKQRSGVREANVLSVSKAAVI